MKDLNIFWFRRDLRLDDNVGFHKALQGKNPVLPIFIFDTEILDSLQAVDDARVTFIHDTLTKMDAVLKQHGSGISVFHGKPLDVFKKITEQFQIAHVITNRDYESYALERDTEVEKYLAEKNIGFHTYKDHVIFEKDDIVKDNGSPYLVYTPYMKKWKSVFKNHIKLHLYDSLPYFKNLWKADDLPFPSLQNLGFKKSSMTVKDYDLSPSLIKEYQAKRDFPSQNGTSYLSPHLRFGTVSIRKVISNAIADKNEVFWQELIWR
mmetsp:Transcript_26515/g.64380  ORF Transcript_26515/g.64380 Transcript_26515/m.64380 type:complete len:264 (-) Transcript_26515:6-797(-)